MYYDTQSKCKHMYMCLGNLSCIAYYDYNVVANYMCN